MPADPDRLMRGQASEDSDGSLTFDIALGRNPWPSTSAVRREAQWDLFSAVSPKVRTTASERTSWVEKGL